MTIEEIIEENNKKIFEMLEDIHYYCQRREFCRDCIFCNKDLECIFIDTPHNWNIERLLKEKREI